MKLGFLMIVMTLLENGQLSAAFVNTESLEDCERRAKAIRTILSDQKIPIKDLVCRSSAAKFEPFSHGAPSAQAHSYVVSIDEREAWITPRTDNAPCDGDPAKPIRYCATSSQKLLSEGN
jgi:hypothetical protein